MYATSVKLLCNTTTNRLRKRSHRQDDELQGHHTMISLCIAISSQNSTSINYVKHGQNGTRKNRNLSDLNWNTGTGA